MGPGTIYGSIQRMEEAGLVEEGPGEDDGRRRRYAMTAAGRDALRAEASRISRLADMARARDLIPGADGA